MKPFYVIAKDPDYPEGTKKTEHAWRAEEVFYFPEVESVENHAIYDHMVPRGCTKSLVGIADLILAEPIYALHGYQLLFREREDQPWRAPSMVGCSKCPPRQVKKEICEECGNTGVRKDSTPNTN